MKEKGKLWKQKNTLFPFGIEAIKEKFFFFFQHSSVIIGSNKKEKEEKSLHYEAFDDSSLHFSLISVIGQENDGEQNSDENHEI